MWGIFCSLTHTPASTGWVTVSSVLADETEMEALIIPPGLPALTGGPSALGAVTAESRAGRGEPEPPRTPELQPALSFPLLDF